MGTHHDIKNVSSAKLYEIGNNRKIPRIESSLNQSIWKIAKSLKGKVCGQNQLNANAMSCLLK